VAANPGVIAVIGTTCSSSARTALPVLSAAGLVMISPSNTVVSLTDPAADWLPGYFRTSPHDLVQARVAAEFAYHQTAARSASTVHDDERYGEQLVQLFVEAFSRLGGEILVQGSVGAGGNRAGAAAAELVNAPPDLVFAPIFEGPALRFLAEVSNQPGLRDTTLLGPDSLLVQSFAQSAGRRANGMYLTGPQPSGPSYEQLLERWLAKYGEHPTSPWHAHAYDAANLLLNAIQRVAVQDPDGTLHIGRSALRDELAATTNYRGITGTLHCTPQGDCAAGESIGVFHLTPAETGRGRWPPSAVWTPRRPAYPGVETVPLSSLSSSVPWLALDAGRVPTLYQISFNVSRPPFDIPLVRQAFASAVNREAIVGLALELGYREPRPATTFVHPQSLGRDLYGQVGWSFDPARARDLLAQAGYPNGRGFPPVQLLSDRGDGRHEAIMNAVARMWRETLGVEVQVVFVDSFRPYLARLEADPPPVFRLGWTLSNDPGETLSLYSADSDSNFGGFSDPSFNRLLEQGLAVRAPAERQALYVAAERILCEQAAASLPLFHYLTP
jgi:branched-chain amino acid transport system substrate-binding protein